MTLASGTRLGPYEIVGAIGSGGMGEVYRARDPKLDRLVAIKVLPPQLAESATALARFEREAKAVAALSHPNILLIFDFGREGTTVFAVMELLDGETMRQKLAAPIPIRKAVEYGVQIARGLAAAHAKGIVHRDLKPENVFVTADGRIKILDFGLARQTLGFAGSDATVPPTIERHTDPGTVLGTVGYMSPEQARGEPGDQRSDLFSLGVVLYELVSGRRAFQRDTAAETLTAILRDDPPELAAASASDVPPALARVIQHCLEKNPAERFQSASDVAFALENLSATSTSAAQAAISGSQRRWSWLPWSVAALFALTTVALLAGRALAPASRSVSFAPLTYRQQSVFRALFAPDGKTVIFSAAPSGVDPEIFALNPEFPEPRSLGAKDVQLLSISSKNELAVLTGAKFLNHRLFDGTLARMPLAGGAPREIAEHVREADWSPDGERLAVIRDVKGRDRLEFPMGKVLYETSGYLSDLRVSPSGDRVAFFEHPIKFDDRGGVAVVDLAGRKATLSEGYWGLEGLVWSRDGNEILFSAGLSYAQFRVYAVSLTGRLRQALESAGGLTIHDVAPDGRWLATRDDIGWNMMVKAPGAHEEADLSWLDFSQPIAFSADGRTLLFTEQGGLVGNNYAVCLRQTDGSPVVRLGEGLAVDLSPDGKRVLAIVPSSRPALMEYPTGVGEARRLETGSIEAFRTARWFPDGRRILLCGAEAGHASRCYVLDAGAPPRAVTPENFGDGFPAPDGRHFLARPGLTGVGGRILSAADAPSLYSIDGGEPQPVPGLTADDAIVRFAPDGRSVIVAHGSLPARVDRVFLDTGRRDLIRVITASQAVGVTAIANIVVANDPSVYAYTPNQQPSRLFIVQGAR
jgi:eukaryotic-like serine/threonine-protein kinase